MLRTLDLFSGIGGFALGLEATGFFRTTCFVELEPYCRLVLKSHWPRTPILGDIKNVTRPDLPDPDPNVADTTGVQRKRSGAKRSGQGRSEKASGGYRSSRAAANYWETEPQVGRLVDGLPDRVSQIRALGNSIIPQIAKEIGNAIKQASEGTL